VREQRDDEEASYVLLCRHARHDDGRLVPSKDGNGIWRFPAESVARVLAEELVIGKDCLRLAKVIYAPTAELQGQRTSFATSARRGPEGQQRAS
jgi:hypothetical protein